jgi:hydroxymethylbilane synthase
MTDTTIVLATRRSKLAIAQARLFARDLERRWPGLHVELLEVVTTGDTVVDVPLRDVGGKGLFTKEIEQALLERKAHIAVHSFKDVPAVISADFAIGCVPARIDARDVVIAKMSLALAALPAGARIGTSSLRRAVQLQKLRPDTEIVPMRGNVDTRLRKLHSGDADAIVLARAGLVRLGFADLPGDVLDPDLFVPAAGQGALAVECLAEDRETLDMLAPMHDPRTGIAVACERSVMASVGADCTVPFGAHARLVGGELHLAAILARPDGSGLGRIDRSYPWPGSEAESAAIGRDAAPALRV